jgi:hypothetical protein
LTAAASGAVGGASSVSSLTGEGTVGGDWVSSGDFAGEDRSIHCSSRADAFGAATEAGGTLATRGIIGRCAVRRGGEASDAAACSSFAEMSRGARTRDGAGLSAGVARTLTSSSLPSSWTGVLIGPPPLSDLTVDAERPSLTLVLPAPLDEIKEEALALLFALKGSHTITAF